MGTYEPEELARFFAACSSVKGLLFRCFLASGFRSREIAALAWPDIGYRAGTFKVEEKPDLGFFPKNYEQRTVTVPHGLIDTLRDAQKQSASRLVFPSPPHPTRRNYGGDKPDAHRLELCKEIAFRAGLHCGGAATKMESDAKTALPARTGFSTNFATCAMDLLQSGVDIRSMMLELGHKNLKTTERYLAKLRQAQMRDRVEASSIARMIA